jgi:hypothetical protein
MGREVLIPKERHFDDIVGEAQARVLFRLKCLQLKTRLIWFLFIASGLMRREPV